MKQSRFADFQNKVFFDKNKKPLEGEHINTIYNKYGFDELQCITTYKHGKIDGSNAVSMSDGYSEDWKEGVFVKMYEAFCQSD